MWVGVWGGWADGPARRVREHLGGEGLERGSQGGIGRRGWWQVQGGVQCLRW